MILNALMSGLFFCADKEHVFIDTDIANIYISMKNFKLHYLTEHYRTTNIIVNTLLQAYLLLKCFNCML